MLGLVIILTCSVPVGDLICPALVLGANEHLFIVSHITSFYGNLRKVATFLFQALLITKFCSPYIPHQGIIFDDGVFVNLFLLDASAFLQYTIHILTVSISC